MKWYCSMSLGHDVPNGMKEQQHLSTIIAPYRRVLGVGAVVLVSIVIAAWWVVQPAAVPSPAATSLGTTATEPATFTSLTGQPLTLEPYEGRIRVVTTWASWCPSCTKQLVMLDRMAADYNEQEVVFLAINRSEPPATAERFLATQPAFTRLTLILDDADHFFASVDGYAMPETVIFDADGNLIHHARGVVTEEKITSALTTALSSQ